MVRNDVQAYCSGMLTMQPSECEAAIHAVRAMFNSPDAENVFLQLTSET